MKRRTRWDVELRVKLDMLADLNYATCGFIVPETLEMENENGWKRLNEHLLARIWVTRARWTVLDGLQLGDAHESVLNCEYRIRLWTVWRLVHHCQDIYADGTREKIGDTDQDVEME